MKLHRLNPVIYFVWTKIKTIKVNGKEVTIYDEMTTNTTKKDIKLKQHHYYGN